MYDYHVTKIVVSYDLCCYIVLPEVYGADSRCFEHEWVSSEGESVSGEEGTLGSGAGCYRYECTGQCVIVYIGEQQVRCKTAGDKVRGGTG